MKKIALLVLIAFIATAHQSICEGAITFDGIMSNAETKITESDNNRVLFNDFCNKFKVLCNAWDASWSIDDVVVLSDSETQIQFNIDGVLITCDNDKEKMYPLTEIAVETGSTFTDYNSIVKAISLFAALEYDLPNTVSERTSLLSIITSRFRSAMDDLELLSNDPKEGDEIVIFIGQNAPFSWRYKNEKFYFVADLTWTFPWD